MRIDEPLYPVNLRLAGKACLVVGGGSVAAQKVRGLVAAGAVVTVVAPAVGPEVEAIDGIAIERRPYERGEAAGYRLVITATDQAAVNQAVHDDADVAGVWVNAADDPARCEFTLPSQLRRGALLLTVSTGAASPAVAVWVRRQLEAQFGDEYATLVELVGEVREQVRADGGSSEGLNWQEALGSGMLALIREGRLAEARERLQACLSSSSD